MRYYTSILLVNATNYINLNTDLVKKIDTPIKEKGYTLQLTDL